MLSAPVSYTHLLAWHYRESDAWLGTLRAQQLVNALISICTRQKLQIPVSYTHLDVYKRQVPNIHTAATAIVPKILFLLKKLFILFI